MMCATQPDEKGAKREERGMGGRKVKVVSGKEGGKGKKRGGK